jgi:hypothetical protein
MWWDDETWVGGFIQELLWAWHEGALPAVTAIGSTWTEHGERTLMVGIEESRDPRQDLPAEDGLGRLVRRVRDRVGEPARSERPDIADLLIPLPLADELTQEELGRFGVKDVTRVVYVGRVRPLARPTALFSRSRSRATAGLLLETDEGPYMTTAGHIGAATGEPLYRRLIAGLLRSPIGEVRATTSPGAPDDPPPGCEGVDIAAVLPHGFEPRDRWEEIQAVAGPEGLMFDDWLCWNGARSGYHEAHLVGTAAEMNRPDRPYKHCLLAAGIESSAGRQGDSGAAAFTDDGSLVGHFIGVHGSPRRRVHPLAWIQVWDVASRYIEQRVGRVHRMWGDRPR